MRWFGRVQRKNREDVRRMRLRMEQLGRKSRGTPHTRYLCVVKEDMKLPGEEMEVVNPEWNKLS